MKHSGSTNVLSVAVNNLHRACLLSGRRENPIRRTTSVAFTVFTGKHWTVMSALVTRSSTITIFCVAQLANISQRARSHCSPVAPTVDIVKVRTFLRHAGWSTHFEKSFISVVKLTFESIFTKRHKLLDGALAGGFHQRCCCFSHCKFCIWWWWCGDCACKQGWNERCLMWWTVISSRPPPRP